MLIEVEFCGFLTHEKLCMIAGNGNLLVRATEPSMVWHMSIKIFNTPTFYSRFYYAKNRQKQRKRGNIMSYWVQETGTHHNFSNYRSFICDYRDDIDKLPKVGIEGEKQEGDTVSSMPCSYGSDCLCLQDSSIWILGKDTNAWQEV